MVEFKCLISRLRYFEITYHGGMETALKVGLQSIFLVVVVVLMDKLRNILARQWKLETPPYL